MTTLDDVYLHPEPAPPTEIVPGLWMGGTRRDETIGVAQPMVGYSPERDFDAVLTLYAWAAPVGWGIEERRFGFPDRQVIKEYIPVINDLAEWTFRQWVSGRRVLIRCQGGMNRSGLLVALVLIRIGRSPDDAIELVRERRHPWALNNHSFVELIKAARHELDGTSIPNGF